MITTEADYLALIKELVVVLETCPVTSDADWIVRRMNIIFRARETLKAKQK
jgi:hypothetical protein